MRVIGHLQSEPAARTFSDFLYVKGIKNQIEAESDGTWAIWIHAEEELEPASAFLTTYLANPNDPGIRATAGQANELLAEEQETAAAAEKRYFDRNRVFPTRTWVGAAPVTVGLIILSVIVYFIQEYSSAAWITQYLFISDPNGFARELEEVRQGQVWRLLTPIFLHFSILHILFNMLWMKDLGAVIEDRLGSLQLLLLVGVIGVASNLAQYYAHGPTFGGMSGVVYGLLGYIWMKGKFDPNSGLFVHPSTVMMMMIWLVLGYMDVLGVAMANTAHLGGLAAGVIWGFFAARVATR